jgi:hypothetical protein
MEFYDSLGSFLLMFMIPLHLIGLASEVVWVLFSSDTMGDSRLPGLTVQELRLNAFTCDASEFNDYHDFGIAIIGVLNLPNDVCTR